MTAQPPKKLKDAAEKMAAKRRTSHSNWWPGKGFEELKAAYRAEVAHIANLLAPRLRAGEFTDTAEDGIKDGDTHFMALENVCGTMPVMRTIRGASMVLALSDHEVHVERLEGDLGLDWAAQESLASDVHAFAVTSGMCKPHHGGKPVGP